MWGKTWLSSDPSPSHSPPRYKPFHDTGMSVNSGIYLGARACWDGGGTVVSRLQHGAASRLLAKPVPDPHAPSTAARGDGGVTDSKTSCLRVRVPDPGSESPKNPQKTQEHLPLPFWVTNLSKPSHSCGAREAALNLILKTEFGVTAWRLPRIIKPRLHFTFQNQSVATTSQGLL